MIESSHQKLQSLLRWLQEEQKRAVLIAVLAIAGLLLLTWETPSHAVQQPTDPMSDPSIYAEQLERRLERLLSQVDGAGKTVVMLTLESGEQSVFAQDIQETTGGSDRNHVLLENGEALIETIQTPQIGGVAVICEGGANVLVVAKIHEILSSLLGLSTGRISVAKMN